jgi:hypothetical protein
VFCTGEAGAMSWPGHGATSGAAASNVKLALLSFGWI